jgi:hypothetical protein
MPGKGSGDITPKREICPSASVNRGVSPHRHVLHYEGIMHIAHFLAASNAIVVITMSGHDRA